MNVFAKFDEIPSMILKVIMETKRYGRTHGWKDGQRENSIPTHKHSLWSYKKERMENSREKVETPFLPS